MALEADATFGQVESNTIHFTAYCLEILDSPNVYHNVLYIAEVMH
jgi:hypothetical protein